jgi:hypothetical protein
MMQSSTIRYDDGTYFAPTHSKAFMYNNETKPMAPMAATYTITMPSLTSSQHSLNKSGPTRRARTLGVVVVVLLITLAALAVACFLFGTGAPPKDTQVKVQGSRTQRLTELPVVDEKKESKFLDSNPSGFDNTVDYVVQYADNFEPIAPFKVPLTWEENVGQFTPPSIEYDLAGPPEPHFVAAGADISPEAAVRMIGKLRQQHPELFPVTAPKGAIEFSIDSIDTSGDWFAPETEMSSEATDMTNMEDNPFGFPPMDIEPTYTINEPLETEPEFAVEPPAGEWQMFDTPPPLENPLKPIKVTFQETDDMPEWEGPLGATWFGQDTSIDVMGETRVSAPWMGADCSVVTNTADAETRVEGDAKCGTSVWYPYHYDVYSNSAVEDWEYIDMKEGPRTHTWPGAGPFRKIHMQTGIVGRDGPICFDMPAKPDNYHGVEPDQLDCALYLTRVVGFGDALRFTDVTSMKVPQDIVTEWWFQWRHL